MVAAWGWLTAAQIHRSSIWFDEAFTIVWSRLPWRDWWAVARSDSGNAALQSALIKVTDALLPGHGVPIVLLELSSSATILATAWLIVRMLRPARCSWIPLFAALCFISAVGTQSVLTEIRSYGPAMAVTAILTEQMARRRPPVRALSAGAFVAPFVHPLLAITTMCAVVRLLAQREVRRHAVRWIALPVLALTATVWLAASNPRGTMQVAHFPPIGLDRAIGQTARFFGTNSPFGWDRMPRGATLCIGICLTLLLTAEGLARLLSVLRHRKETNVPLRGSSVTAIDRTGATVVAVLATTLVVLAIASAAGPVGYLENPRRYLLSVLPLWFVQLGIGAQRLVDFIVRRHRRLWVLLASLTCALVTGGRAAEIGRAPRYEAADTVTMPRLASALKADAATTTTGIVLGGFDWYVIRAGIATGRFTIPPPYALTAPLDNCVPERVGPGSRRWRFAPKKVFGDAERDAPRYARLLVQQPEACVAEVVARWHNAVIMAQPSDPSLSEPGQNPTMDIPGS